MKLFNFLKDGTVCLGILTNKGHMNAVETAQKLGLCCPQSVDEAIVFPLDALKKIAACENPVLLDEKSISFAPAVVNPQKILCVGLNYAAHAKETNTPLPSAPVIFAKYGNALNHHGGSIVLRDSAKQYDYEAELTIVMGKEAANVPVEEALSYVFGYTCGNDFSARDIQKRTSQWTLGKSMDGFAPVGPYVATADETDPGNLNISSYVNGERRQHSNTSDLIFNCAHLISDISSFLTLKPGDLILTGTPSGVIAGYEKEDQIWLKAGDVVEIEIEGIGKLLNTLK